ncbi:MAG: hypothetical protein ACRERU_02140 [Methylococcales bacterium]
MLELSAAAGRSSATRRSPRTPRRSAPSQQVGGLQRRLDALIFLVRQLATDGAALAFAILEKAERFAPLSATPLEPFFDDYRRSVAFVHRQVVGDQRVMRFFVLDFDNNRPIAAAVFNSLNSTSRSARKFRTLRYSMRAGPSACRRQISCLGLQESLGVLHPHRAGQQLGEQVVAQLGEFPGFKDAGNN